MELANELRAALASGTPPAKVPPRPAKLDSGEYAIWRLLTAWHHTPSITADHAVLLRQVARWSPDLVLGRLPAELLALASKVGVRPTGSGQLNAEPFAPTWLPAPEAGGAFEVDAPPKLRREPEDVPAEPYLARFGHTAWQSMAQKEAVWMALNAPPRSTTLIALPTGAGKSLCFQVLPHFGTGLTIVVVPTVALALDQTRQAASRFGTMPSVNPVCYSSDEHADRVLSQIREHKTRLVFTSPEACVAGRLRPVLEAAISEGWLENLVVDEAHMIEAWGAYFRIEFQLLSVLWHRWLEAPSCRLRTFLLSATFTASGSELLRQLFWAAGLAWREWISQRLRPELTYFAKDFGTDDARRDAVLECAWRLPRPAILYTTKVEDAEEWVKTLRQEGFRRIAAFHGETSSTEKRDLLDAWREDRLDTMIATSAFGMGVDKPNVRAVVHACLPETLHRYYQEVGRGGRDGSSAVCMLLPTRSDRKVARSLGPKLLRPQTVQRRWNGLWSTHEIAPEGDHRYWLRVNARPLDLVGVRTHNEHVRWNKRLLLQLQRAGLLELQDMAWREDPSPTPNSDSPFAEWFQVRLISGFSPASPHVGEMIRGARTDELRTLRKGLSDMEAVLAGGKCIGVLLRDVYGHDITQRTCGGCPYCRSKGREFHCPPLRVDVAPSNSAALPLVVSGTPDPLVARGEVAWRRALRGWLKKGYRRFACAPDMQRRLLALCETVDPDARFPFRLDAIDPRAPFVVSADETLVVLHLETLMTDALNLHVGRRVIHLIGAGVRPFLDAQGRRPLESQGAPLESYEVWNVH
jgi:ATP-dependent DNA helicase RecQ